MAGNVVPKKRMSKSRRNMRRTFYRLDPVYASVCPECGAPRARHHACLSCGTYRKKKVIARATA